MPLRNVAAITGYAEFKSQKTADGLTPMALTAEIARRTALDAGVSPGEIDGLLVTTPVAAYSMFWPSAVAEHLGMKLKYFDTVELGGASAAGMVWRAAAAIQAGLCDRVLCLTVEVPSADRNNGRKGMLRSESVTEFEIPFGASPPNAGYAMVARRHMHEFGTKPEQLAKIAVDQRTSALSNPLALFNQRALTIDDVLNSKMIFDPLHLLEIVSPCVGGSAVLVTRESLANRGPNPPVRLLGAGEAGSHLSITHRRDITTSWSKQSAEAAFAMAGVSPARVDVAQLYDCYTIAVLMAIEDLGFCAKGHGGPFVAEHDLTFAGDFPCNTNGGQLSFGQAGAAGGMTHVVEGVRQLMGRAEARQVKGATVGVVHGNGGVMSDEVTLVLAN